MSESELATLRAENERLRGELSRLERERATERAQLRSAQGRTLALQADLDEAHAHLGARVTLPRRVLRKGRTLAGRVLRRVGLRRG